MSSHLDKSKGSLTKSNRACNQRLIELNYQQHVLINAKSNQEQVFRLAKGIAKAQFDLADQELTKRLWEEVATKDIDPERILNLMYSCNHFEDIETIVQADSRYIEQAFT